MKTNPTILVVEDEEAIRDMIRFGLQTHFTVLEASDCLAAEHVMAEQLPDLILLDWMLPGKSGVEFTQQLRKTKLTQHIPIIMLTARAEEGNKIKGLASGADDYITKPFSPKELTARIHAVLRRGPIQSPGNLLVANQLQLDINQHTVTIRGKAIDLTHNEFRLLHFLLSHTEHVFSRDDLINHAWGPGVFIDERTVDAQIKRLRQVLKPHGYDQYIETVRGVGYRFNTTPE